MEFKGFNEIKRLSNLKMSVTQKIHGSNAQVVVTGDEVQAGSRNRWIYPHDDNFGFASFVERNKEAFVKLGQGTHFGEWAGPGINSGEGLTEKTLVLFDYNRYVGIELPPQTVLVPVLYEGDLDLSLIPQIMEKLKTEGSRLTPGFMRPEGIVVQFNGSRFKQVFEAEETSWKKSSGAPKGVNKKETVDFSHLCQPIRLEKLLSRDEVYQREYPKSLPDLVKAYVADLLKEDQITGTEDEVRSVTKGASSQIFAFIRTTMNTRGF